jgi:hypothetical protein
VILTVLLAASAFVGWGLEVRGGLQPAPGIGDSVLSFAVGAAIAALATLAAAPFAPLSPTLLSCGWWFWVVGGLAALAFRNFRPRVARVATPGTSNAAERATRLLVLGGLGLLAWKTLVLPLWSWDHFAMWGAKARMMAAGGLDLGFLHGPFGHPSRPDHPLGLPALWLLFSAFRVPGESLFKLSHVLFGVALAGCFFGAARRLGASGWLATLLTAFVSVSPLYGDSEMAGLAEMPLALWVCAAAAWLARGPLGRRAALAAGITIGFLPWVKQEGWPLALLLLAAALLWNPGNQPTTGSVRSAAWIGTPVLALSALALAYQRLVLPADAGFVGGGWGQRALDRLVELPATLRVAAGELFAADWLGFWWVMLLVPALAILRRNRAAMILASVVWIQAALYFMMCFLSFAPPADQLRAAFYRTCSVLVPLGLLSIAALSRPSRASGPQIA